MTQTHREPDHTDADAGGDTDGTVTAGGRSRNGRDRTRSRRRDRGDARASDERGDALPSDAEHGGTDGSADSAIAEPTSDAVTADEVDAAGAAGDAPGGAGDSDERRDDASQDDDGGRRRRRRRGRRGRGRGKGRDEATDADAESEFDARDSRGDRPDHAADGGSAEAPAAEAGSAETGRAEVAETVEAAASTEPRADGDGDRPDGDDGRDREPARERQPSRGRTRARTSAGSDRPSGARGSAQPDASPDPEDGAGGAAKSGDEVERAIARGGTRIAAKRGGNRRQDGGPGRRQQRPRGVAEEVRRAILEGPPRTMLVTAREDRTQIAVMEDRTVVEHYVTRKEDVTYVGNIYMARVQNVLPGMEAAFLDIGKGRNGVLYAGEVLYDELDLEEGEDERIENVLKPGQKVLVQVTKDPMSSKGPRLTMHLSLAGRYMVLAPTSDLFGISRKLTDRERDRLRRIVKRVKPKEHGVIVRTAAEGASEDQITADLERLLKKWEKVEQAASDAKALTPVYEEPPLVVKVIRDNFGPEFERCIVDDEELYHQVRAYLDEVAPELIDKVELYGAPTADARAKAAGAPSLEEPDAGVGDDAGTDGRTGTDGSADDDATTGKTAADGDAKARRAVKAEGEPTDEDGTAEGEPTDEDGTGDDADAASGSSGPVDLAAAAERRKQLPALFDAYDVADQLRRAMGRKVWLPSGGYLIIESTEAMKVIDVNTGKFTGGADTNLEEVVLKTNLEAAEEIVRQLRLRDMGGIIIIDFIDMLLKANQDQVVRRLKRELLRDRTKTRVSEVSRLGLVQMTRKNVSQGLLESFSHSCEECEGRGIISELD